MQNRKTNIKLLFLIFIFGYMMYNQKSLYLLPYGRRKIFPIKLFIMVLKRKHHFQLL